MAVGVSSPDIDRPATGGRSGLSLVVVVVVVEGAGSGLIGSLLASGTAAEALFRFAIVYLQGDWNCRSVRGFLLMDGVFCRIRLCSGGEEVGNVFSPPRFRHVTPALAPKQQSHASSLVLHPFLTRPANQAFLPLPTFRRQKKRSETPQRAHTTIRAQRNPNPPPLPTSPHPPQQPNTPYPPQRPLYVLGSLR